MRPIRFLGWVLALSCLLIFEESVFAWGEHPLHARLVREILLPALASLEGAPVLRAKDLDEFVTLYSEYPDWGWGLTGKRKDDLWGYFLDNHKKRGLDGNTHSNRSSLGHFQLLLQTLAAGKIRESLVWAGCLTHQVGDAAATNHTPLLMYVIYGYGTWGLTYEEGGRRVTDDGGGWLDLGVVQDKAGRKYLEQELKDYRPTMLADNALDAAIQLQIMLHKNSLVPLPEELAITRAHAKWVTSRDAAAKDELARGMARVVARCTKDAADVIYTAVRLVKAKQTTFSYEEAVTKAAPSIAALRNAFPLSGVSAYKDLLDGKGAGRGVGVFLGLPPMYWVAPGAVELQDCYFLSIIARTLKREGIPCHIYDIRKPPARLDPKQVPLMILSPYRQVDGLKVADFEKLIRQYLADGGRILFVGGSPNYPILKPLSDSFAPSQHPNKHDYPLTSEDMQNSKVTYAEVKAEKRVFPVVRVMSDFDTRGSGNYVLKPDPPKTVAPVLFLEAGDRKVAISAGHVENGSYNIIYAPWYLFMPYTFQKSKAVKQLYQPTLDGEGTALLRYLVEQLRAPSNSKEEGAAPGSYGNGQVELRLVLGLLLGAVLLVCYRWIVRYVSGPANLPRRRLMEGR